MRDKNCPMFTVHPTLLASGYVEYLMTGFLDAIASLVVGMTVSKIFPKLFYCRMMDFFKVESPSFCNKIVVHNIKLKENWLSEKVGHSENSSTLEKLDTFESLAQFIKR